MVRRGRGVNNIKGVVLVIAWLSAIRALPQHYYCPQADKINNTWLLMLTGIYISTYLCYSREQKELSQESWSLHTYLPTGNEASTAYKQLSEPQRETNWSYDIMIVSPHKLVPVHNCGVFYLPQQYTLCLRHHLPWRHVRFTDSLTLIKLIEIL